MKIEPKDDIQLALAIKDEIETLEVFEKDSKDLSGSCYSQQPLYSFRWQRHVYRFEFPGKYKRIDSDFVTGNRQPCRCRKHQHRRGNFVQREAAGRNGNFRKYPGIKNRSRKVRRNYPQRKQSG